VLDAPRRLEIHGAFMSPPGSRFATRRWLAAALLALGAHGCAALFGMDDASCSDCVATAELPAKPAADSLDPAAGGTGGAAPDAATADAQNRVPPARLDPATPGGPTQADPPPPDASPDAGGPPEPCTRYCDAIS